MPLLAVAAGGLAGSAARAVIGEVAAVESDWPVATPVVNLAGAFLLGAYLARRSGAVAGPWSLQLWAIGALGSFTTFSAFSLEVVLLLDAGSVGVAAGYVGLSTFGGLAAALGGDVAGGRRP